MTSIAFDGKTFVSDSRMIGNFIEKRQVKKIIKISNKRGEFIVGFAGKVAQCMMFVDWYEEDSQEHIDLTEEFCALVYEVKTKTLFYYDNTLFPVEVGVPNAIGSGAEFAMGAMLAGANAERAVKIACQLDSNSGLPLFKVKV